MPDSTAAVASLKRRAVRLIRLVDRLDKEVSNLQATDRHVVGMALHAAASALTVAEWQLGELLPRRTDL